MILYDHTIYNILRQVFAIWLSLSHRFQNLNMCLFKDSTARKTNINAANFTDEYTYTTYMYAYVTNL